MAKEEKTFTFTLKKKEIFAIVGGLFITYIMVFLLGVELGKEFFVSSIPIENLQQNQYPPFTTAQPTQPTVPPQPYPPQSTNQTPEQLQAPQIQPSQQLPQAQETVSANQTTMNETHPKQTLTATSRPTVIQETRPEIKQAKVKKETVQKKTQEASKLKEEEKDTTEIKKTVTAIKKDILVTSPTPTKTVNPQEVSNKYTTPKAQNPKKYYVQVGAFTDDKNALELANRLRSKGLPAVVQKAGPLYKVMIGPYDSENKAREILPKVRQEELYGYVVSF